MNSIETEKLSSKRANVDLKNTKWYKRPTLPRKCKHSKKFKLPERQEKITKYLEKPDCCNSEKRQKTEHKIKQKSELPKKSDKYLSPSAKLDSIVPKPEDILRSREEKERFEQIQNLIKKSAEKFLNGLQESGTKTEQPKKDVQDWDCKHLTLKEIEEHFSKNVAFLDGIFHGTIYNERHVKFKKHAAHNSMENDLRVSESISAFTQDQLIYIVSLFRSRYDKGNRYKHSDYYFKVLLPEYCLKLFIDCHEMTNSEAMDYLKSKPVPDYLGLFT